MKKCSSLKRMIIILHTLPQTFVGFLLFMYYYLKGNFVKIDKFPPEAECCYVIFVKGTKIFSGASLGLFIILPSYKNNKKTIKHEFGHFKQGIITGWLYLLLIGLPSIMLNTVSRFNYDVYKDYYNRYPEKWADELGEVER